MAAYIALLRKDATSDYGVDFPDFPGCVTAGADLNEARAMAAEALAGHVAFMIERGDEIPPPSDLAALMVDPQNRDAIGFLVDVPARQARSVRINVMMPEDVVAAIDRATTNRSRFLVEAARLKLRQAA